MGEKTLVDSLVTDAIELIKKLDEIKLPPSFIAWYYYDDAEEWRLIIAATSLDALLPKQEAIAYRKVIEALSEITASTLSVSDLKIVPTSAQLVTSMKFLVGTGPSGIVRAHFRDCTMNGIFIKEVVILRSA